jgi:hypothetical protein
MAQFILQAKPDQHRKFVRIRQSLMDQCEREFKRFELEDVIAYFMRPSRFYYYYYYFLQIECS